MLKNRETKKMLTPQLPEPIRHEKKQTKKEKAKEHKPGSKAMRKFIIEEKPPKQVVREHLEAYIEKMTASDSDSD